MTPCKNCGRGIHLHWTGGWIHDEPTPSGNYLYCGFRAEPEGGVVMKIEDWLLAEGDGDR